MDTTAETDDTALRRSAPGPAKSIPEPAIEKPLIYRQFAWTRITHWVWAISLFFLLLTGLQIFNAHPTLYIGDQSGFGFDNDVLKIGAENTEAGPRGYTELLGAKFDTSGVLGMSGPAERPRYVAFPGWATIPSHHDLATGRVIHFFFAWLLVGTLLAWLAASVVNGHLRELVPTLGDIKRLPRDIADHARLRFHHTRDYNTLQKLTYAVVLFVFFPLMILTGLAMAPGGDALLPFLPDMLGGRQTARTIHFVVMTLLVAFFVIHIVMILAAGPINELRSIITGWYRTDPPVDEIDLAPAEATTESSARP
jgi:thiosulfate reductase cytochrome b subunit